MDSLTLGIRLTDFVMSVMVSLRGIFTETDYVSIFSQILIQMMVYLTWRKVARVVLTSYFSKKPYWNAL